MFLSNVMNSGRSSRSIAEFESSWNRKDIENHNNYAMDVFQNKIYSLFRKVYLDVPGIQETFDELLYVKPEIISNTKEQLYFLLRHFVLSALDEDNTLFDKWIDLCERNCPNLAIINNNKLEWISICEHQKKDMNQLYRDCYFTYVFNTITESVIAINKIKNLFTENMHLEKTFKNNICGRIEIQEWKGNQYYIDLLFKL